MQKFLIHWLISSISLGVAAWVLPGVAITAVPSLLVGALVLGFLNAVVRPVLLILTLPITVLTLGLFYLVLNGLVFGLGAAIVPGFTVDGFGWAVLGALLTGFVSLVVNAAVRSPREEGQV